MATYRQKACPTCESHFWHSIEDCSNRHCCNACCDKCGLQLDSGLICQECTDRGIANLLLALIEEPEGCALAEQGLCADLKLCAEAGCTMEETAAFLGMTGRAN